MNNAIDITKGHTGGAFERWACAQGTGTPTPAYVYDVGALRARVAELQAAFSGFGAQLYFASMANDRPEILQILAGLGLGACVNSPKHLALALEAGFPHDHIHFTSTGLPPATLRLLRERDIMLNIDSFDQIEAWAAVGGVKAGVRINAASLGAGRPFDRMGVAAADLQELLAFATRCGVTVEGLHVYVGTNILNPGEILPTLDAFFALGAGISELRYVNIGGGIGVDYSYEGADFDVALYADGLAGFAAELRGKMPHRIDVIVEPGRGLAASCGKMVTRVTAEKTLSGIRYVGVDASIATFPRPFHHPESPHRIRVLNPEGQSAEASDCIVCGCTTFSRDILGEAKLPRSLEVGDLLVIDDAGAYSQSMMSRFLGQPEPHTFFLE